MTGRTRRPARLWLAPVLHRRVDGVVLRLEKLLKALPPSWEMAFVPRLLIKSWPGSAAAQAQVDTDPKASKLKLVLGILPI